MLSRDIQGPVEQLQQEKQSAFEMESRYLKNENSEPAQRLSTAEVANIEKRLQAIKHQFQYQYHKTFQRGSLRGTPHECAFHGHDRIDGLELITYEPPNASSSVPQTRASDSIVSAGSFVNDRYTELSKRATAVPTVTNDVANRSSKPSTANAFCLSFSTDD